MENFVRMFMILAEVAVGVIRAFLEDKIQPDNFETFLRKHKHDFYHLCYNRGRCCSCGLSPTFLPQALLRKAQLDLLFVQHPGANCLSRFCCCSYIATPNIQLETIDITLCFAIINNFVTLDKFQNDFLNDIRIVRNEISHFAHQHDITSVEFDRMWKKVTKASIHLATCIKTSSSNTYSADIQEKIERLRNRPILAVEYTDSLREIVKWINGNEEHRVEMDETLKRIENKIDGIPDVIFNLFLKFQQTSFEHDDDLSYTTATQPKIIEGKMMSGHMGTTCRCYGLAWQREWDSRLLTLFNEINKTTQFAERGQHVFKKATKDENCTCNMTKHLSEKRMSAASTYRQKKKGDVKVTIAVVGRSATGKSAFINTMRGVNQGDKGHAKLGSTRIPTPYQHPYNERIVFYDSPGYDTLFFPMEKYLSVMKIKQYDYFIMMYDCVLSEKCYFLVHELLKLKKSFCLVRTKIDTEFQFATEEGMREEEVIPFIRNKFKPDNDVMNNADALFLISSRRTDIGDWAQLTCHIDKCLQAATI